MRIAIIGAGQVGTTLGGGWARAGHEVVYGSRQGARAANGGVTTRPIADAVAASEVVVLTVPWAGALDTVAAVGDFGGRILIDATNPVGPGFQLTVGHSGSGAEQVAARAKNARVVKAFNTTGVENMANPSYGELRAFLPVVGDDAEARETVVKLARDLGFDAVAIGGLARARVTEPLALLWIRLAFQRGLGRGFALAVARGGAPTPPPTREGPARVITVVGAGNIGGGLARAWLRAGHEVRLAVRDAQSEDARELAAGGAHVVPVAGAAAGADVVALAVPAGAAVETARQLGGLHGKVVIDATNAIGPGLTLQQGHTTSSAEQLQQALPGARVARSFNQQGAETLRTPRFHGVAATNLVAADDPEARAIVTGLSRDVGLDSLDVGPLDWSRLLEPVTIVWIALAQATGSRDFGFTLVHRR